MEKISAFKTSDGTVFYNRKEAKLYQATIDKFDNLRALAAATGNSIDADLLGDYLVDNADKIERILKGEKYEAPIANEVVEADKAEAADDELTQLLEEVAPAA